VYKFGMKERDLQSWAGHGYIRSSDLPVRLFQHSRSLHFSASPPGVVGIWFTALA